MRKREDLNSGDLESNPASTTTGHVTSGSYFISMHFNFLTLIIKKLCLRISKSPSDAETKIAYSDLYICIMTIGKTYSRL